MNVAVAGPGDRFIGRAAFLEPLADLVRRGGTNIVLHGEVGVGRSRITTELLAIARSVGRPTLFLRCSTASQDLPLGAFAPVLPVNFASDTGLHVLLQARRAMSELGDGSPVLLGVDDLHFLDDASALLLTQLVESGEAELIGNYRSGAHVPDPLGGLWHRGDAERHLVAPLGRSDTVGMAEHLAGGPLDDESAERVVTLSCGNPLHLSILIRACREADAISVGPDGRRAIGDFHNASTLVDFVEAQLSLLDDATRAALGVVALAEPLGIPEVESLTGLGVVALLEDHGYVEVVTEGRRTRVRVAHPLFAEIIRARMSRLRVRMVFNDLAAMAEKYDFRRREDLLRAAHWAVEGGLELRSDVAVAAARAAWFANDVVLAERVSRDAYERHHSFEAGQILSDVLFETGRGDEVEEIMAGLMSSAVSDDELVASTCGRALNRFWRLADLPGALELLDGTETVVNGLNHLAELDASRATMLAFAGRAEEALRLADPILRGPLSRAKMHALLSSTVALRHLGRAAEAVGIVDAANSELSNIPEWLNLIESTVLRAGRITALNEVGNFDDVEQEAMELRDHCRSVGNSSVLALVDLALGQALCGQGRHHSGLAYLEESARMLRESSHRGQRRWALSLAATAAAESGRADRCRELLAELDAVPRHPATLWVGHEWRARAWLARLDLRPEDARELMTRAADTALAVGDVPGTVACLHDLVRFGDARTASRRLARVDHLARNGNGGCGPLVDAFSSRIRANDMKDHESLAKVSKDFEALHAMLFAAETAHEAAVLASSRGVQRIAVAQNERAIRLRERCEVEAAPTAPVVGPALLTRREREIAELAARGMSTRDIADRLYLSPRTVDNHLARAYVKLDVRTRTQLTELFATTFPT